MFIQGSASPATACGEEMTSRVLADAMQDGEEEVSLNCSLMVPSECVNRGGVITKWLVVEGSAGSGITIDCNSGIIDGAKYPELVGSTPNKRNMVLITSQGSGDLAGGG
jgi:hypothetical protein